MSPTDYRTLINRGRKAGLNTRELYSAMVTRSSEGAEQIPNQLDGNGFVSGYDQKGRRVFRPLNGGRI